MDPTGELAVTPALVPTKLRRFTASHRADRNFFLLFLVVCWVGVIMGFAPAVALRWNGHADFPAPPVLIIHALAFSSWLALLTVQTLLVRAKHVALHMKLGLVAVVLIPIMAITTGLSEIYTQRWHLSHPPDNLQFLVFPIFWVVGFTLLAAAAVASRKNPAGHKRLILLATTVIVGAAYDRWWGEGLTKIFGDSVGALMVEEFTATNLILVGALAYDFMTRGRLHRVYAVDLPPLLAAELASSILWTSPGWHPVAAAIVGHN